MIKTLTTAAIISAHAAAALAQPLPAPPTEKYSAPAAQLCETQTLQVYFPAGMTELTAAAEAMLAEAKTHLEGCAIGPAALHAVAGDAASNDDASELAQARIVSVTSALNAHQLSHGNIAQNIQSVAPAQYTAPSDRRVEIQLSAWSPEIG